jgi:hypothetical protein
MESEYGVTAGGFTLRNLRDDLEDLGTNFDGAPDLEFRVFVGRGAASGRQPRREGEHGRDDSRQSRSTT